ncbi:MAG: hypothetical protein CMJ58_25365 [Planctomycetaceae bacterium]|nr:hypothetical protein [Planctomycetaceae bacterium]
MITQFLDWVRQLSGHEAIVAVVGISFFVVQILLSWRVFWRAGSQRRTLKDLNQELSWGSDGRCEVAEAPRRFGWLRWVLAEFPAPAPNATPEEKAPTGRFTRDEALHELDVRIASEPAYLMLQRMSVMAPLLGVVLTVLGFYWLEVNGEGERSLGTILAAVTPLVSGVGTGAVLALINQILLHLASGRLERLRITARTWFDAAIWRHAGRAQPATAAALVDQQKVARSFAAVAAQLEQAVATFQHDLEGVPRALRDARDALKASAHLLEDLAPAATRSVSNLDVSVAAFRTTIDHEFHDAARLQLQASKVLAAAVADISEATQRLHGAEDHAPPAPPAPLSAAGNGSKPR